MTPNDKKLIRSRFASRLHSYDQHARVQEQVCGRLDALIGRLLERPPARALEIGAGTGFLSRRLLDRYPAACWYVNDLVPLSRTYVERYTPGRRVEFLTGDAEEIPFPPDLDLIATASTVQWFDDLDGFLDRSFRALTPGGILALSTFGGGNFREIAHAAGQGLDYLPPEAVESRAAARGFRTLHLEAYTQEMLFDSPTEVLRHIKLTGVNGIRSVAWTKRVLEDFCQAYRSRFATPDGQVVLTYHPVLYLGAR